jgi:hypothetical protein
VNFGEIGINLELGLIRDPQSGECAESALNRRIYGRSASTGSHALPRVRLFGNRIPRRRCDPHLIAVDSFRPATVRRLFTAPA